jgi:hypothetical protein
VTEAELQHHPTPVTVAKLVYNTGVRFVHDRAALIIISAFVLVMAWGHHGDLELMHGFWDGWQGPGSDPATRGTVIPGVPWDQEWVSFWAGTLLVVVIPAAVIKFVLHERLRDFGLGLPRDRLRLMGVSAVSLLVVGLPIFYIGAQDGGMQDTYPLYRGQFDGDLEFIVYELGYLPFFLAIEFIFRGYLLFGLYRLRDRDAARIAMGESGPLVFGYYAILVSMLSYTAWHLGKPVPELWGTLAWGIVAGTIALATRTIWPIVIVHWLLNVFLDLVIWKGW